MRPKSPRSTADKLTKDRARGRIHYEFDGEKYRIEMRASGLVVRRSGGRHKNHKPLAEVIDFIMGQERLPLTGRIPN